jgi:Mg-chelatase subunit ChlD
MPKGFTANALLAFFAAGAVACGYPDIGEGPEGTNTTRAAVRRAIAYESSESVGLDPQEGEPSLGPVAPGCEAKQSVRVEPEAGLLVFQVSRSNTMADHNKLALAREALRAFFTDAASRSVQASVSVFPRRLDAQKTLSGLVCDAGDYTQPSVGMEMQALPSRALADAAGDVMRTAHGAPVADALHGAHRYARGITENHLGQRPSVVLITDDEVKGCDNAANDVETIARSARSANGARTFVVGLGGSSRLHPVAAAGGTEKALLVDPKSPTVARELRDAFEEIRRRTFSCALPLARVPQGAHLDLRSLVVAAEVPGKGTVTIAESPSCEGGRGYQLDSDEDPRSLVLCPRTCDEIMLPESTFEETFACLAN